MQFFRYRYADGSVKLRNPNIELMDQDILYHLALGSESHDLQEMFGDVKVSRRHISAIFVLFLSNTRFLSLALIFQFELFFAMNQNTAEH